MCQNDCFIFIQGIVLFSSCPLASLQSPSLSKLYCSSDSSSSPASYRIVALSKYFPQTSQIKFLEEVSTGHCVGAISQGPHTIHRDKITPPPPPLLHCAVLYETLLYIDMLFVAINISIRYGSKWVTYCCSYIFHNKTIICEWILEFEVSIDPY